MHDEEDIILRRETIPSEPERDRERETERWTDRQSDIETEREHHCTAKRQASSGA